MAVAAAADFALDDVELIDFDVVAVAAAVYCCLQTIANTHVERTRLRP